MTLSPLEPPPPNPQPVVHGCRADVRTGKDEVVTYDVSLVGARGELPDVGSVQRCCELAGGTGPGLGCSDSSRHRFAYSLQSGQTTGA